MLTAGCLDDLVEELREDVAAGLFAGAQMAVSLAGESVAEVAVGSCLPGRAMGISTVHNLYCGLKPVVALSLARVLEANGLDERVGLRELLGPEVGSATLADVLCHRVGLVRPFGWEMVFMGEDRQATELQASALFRARADHAAAYSEVAAWAIVTDVIEVLTGRPAIEQVEADLALLGVDDVWFRATGYDDPKYDEIGCYVSRTDTGVPIPLLHDRVEFMWNRRRPTVTIGYASMGGLAQWYQCVLDVVAGRERAGLPRSETVRRWIAPHRERTHDAVLQRTCGFGYGFMTGLRDHNFGRAPSPQSFGHSGYLGMSFAFADPAHGLVVAMMTNAISSDVRIGAEFNRRRRVAAVYRALGLTAP